MLIYKHVQEYISIIISEKELIGIIFNCFMTVSIILKKKSLLKWYHFFVPDIYVIF